MKHVHLAGVELEGGWDKLPPDTILRDDISLRGFHDRWGGSFCVGEAISPPMQLPKLLEWTERNYPQYSDVHDPHRAGHEANCSMHVHVSTKTTLDYAKLMSRGFFTAFKAGLEKWGKDHKIPQEHYFWTRASGKHRFCSGEFHPSKQSILRNKVDVRRTMLNYCWALHKTVECRVFPLFPEKSLGVDAVAWFVTFVEEWLKQQVQPEKGLAIIRREKDLQALNTRATRVYEF